jgi:hypothetical protein
MTDRAKGCWVAFDENIRVDDVEPLVEAIKMLRGVLAVELQISTPQDYIAESRARAAIAEKIYKALE